MTKIFSGLIIMVFIIAMGCKYNNEVMDCSTISGATFSSNGGKIQSILNSKCSGSDCHSSGGTGSIHWKVGSYTTLGDHFFEEAVESMVNGTMPPAGSIKLSSTEVSLFECWEEAGYPE